MSILKLEVFETPQANYQGQPVVMQASQIEDLKLQSYEAGYTAGWEDATIAGKDEQQKSLSGLANNLQHLSFTFQEARSHILRSVQPVLINLSTQLLPQISKEALGPMVLETLMPIFDSLSETPIRVVLNLASRPSVERLLTQASGLPLSFEEEATLGESQVYLRLGEVEHRIDLNLAVENITRFIHEFVEYSEKEDKHG